MTIPSNILIWIHSAAVGLTAAVAAIMLIPVIASHAQIGTNITISPNVPNELNPPFTAGPPTSGGAPAATPEQAAAFAWQEFIALNWPAGPQMGQEGQRDTPSSSCKFDDPKCNTGPTVWQTFRGKVEIFPGAGNPPGYPGVTSGDKSLGYDALPQYSYIFPVPACNKDQSGDSVPWVNLDETDQITFDSMYAGVVTAAASTSNASPKLIRFLAKGNRAEYTYVAKNQWWSSVPGTVVTNTKNYLMQNMASPPADNTTMVSLPYGSIEIKAGWRVLNPGEASSGHFVMTTARSYESPSAGATCYVDAIWGLVALHIIQKTPSAPYFIYATFEQADNILTENGTSVEDPDGVLITQPASATTPQVCLQNPRPSAGQPVTSEVVVTTNPATCASVTSPTYCTSPKNQLYYQETMGLPSVPTGGLICVNRRYQDIPAEVISANKAAHAAIKAYIQQNYGIASSPSLFYKLVNVQYFPYDKIPDGRPNGSPYQSQPPYTAQNPSPSSYYQANIVVETDRSLQQFSGGAVADGSTGSITDWNMWTTSRPSDAFHKNVYYGGHFYNMGGCMGCHGSQGQNPSGQAGDFSVILARGSVLFPEVPANVTSTGASLVRRNRSLR